MAAISDYVRAVCSLKPTCVCFPDEVLFLGWQLIRSFNAHVQEHSMLCREHKAKARDLTRLHEALKLLCQYPLLVKHYVSLWFLAEDKEEFPVLTVNVKEKTVKVHDLDAFSPSQEIQEIVDDQFNVSFESLRKYRAKISALDPQFFHEIPLTMEVITEKETETYFVGSALFDTYMHDLIIQNIVRTNLLS